MKSISSYHLEYHHVTLIARVLLITWLLPCLALSQYTDYHNRHVDSLEQVLATNPPEGAELRKIYGDLGYGYLNINTEKSIYYERIYIALSIPVDAWRNVNSGYHVLGMNYRSISQYDSAMVCYEKALEAAEQMRNFPEKYTEQNIDDGFSKVYGEIGNFYNAQGKYHQAIEYYIRALKIFEKNDWKESQTIAYFNIGEIYQTMDNYEQAEINFLKSDSLAQATGLALHIVGAKWYLSSLYLRTKEYEKALQNAEIALEYYLSHPEEEGIAIIETLTLLSEIYLEGYDNETRAEEYVRQALALLGDLNIPREKAILLRIVSMLHSRRGEWRKAEQTALEALATDGIEPTNTLALYEILSKVYAHQGNTAKSDEYFDRHKTLQSSWSTKNYQSAIREMEVIYETKKKEMEIERGQMEIESQQRIITRQNMQRRLLAAGVIVCGVMLAMLWYMLRLRNRRNRALAEINLTKDKFFNIISHDLKNPAISQRDALQVLVNNAPAWDAETLADYHSELLKSADGQVELIMNLLSWSKLQTGRMTFTPETFVLSDLLPNLSLIRKMAENKHITLTVRIPENTPVTGDSNIISTVIRNLLTNAVKFTPSGGQVTLSISPCSTGYTVAISDTGMGMSEEQLNNLFRLDKTHSNQGTSGEQGSGLGLIVCRELLEKHGSELYVESKEGKGSRFWFDV